MPIDTSEPKSEGWWLQRLLTRLADRRPHYDLLESYYDGTNVIPVHADRACSDAYRRLMAVSNTNYAELVVEAVRERMQPVGFRLSGEDGPTGNERARQIWLANSLNADSAQVHAASLSMGMAYVIVGDKRDPEIGAPLITPEDPREVIVETDPARRRRVLAGLKAFHDTVDGVDRAYLYLPGKVLRAVRDSTRTNVDAERGLLTFDSGWEWEGDPEVYEGPPRVVPFANRPKIGHMVTRGEYETHLALLDRINYTILQRVEIATLQAFRQRAILVDPEDMPDRDPETGAEVNYDSILEQAPGSLWRLPMTAKLWESGQVDLGPVRQAIRDDVQDLCAVTRTPLYYMNPDSFSGSAEGASLAKEGLYFKAVDRMTEAGESWDQVMALAMSADGDTPVDRSVMEVIWAPPERRSLSEKADAASKALAGGMTWRATMQDVWGLSPAEIDEMERERAAEALAAEGAALVGRVMNGSSPSGQPEVG